MRPLSATVEDLGIKKGSSRGKLCRDSAIVKHMFERDELELRSTTLPHNCRCCTEALSFIKFMSVNFPLYIAKRLLNVFQNGLVAMVPFALGARLKNLTPISA